MGCTNNLYNLFFERFTILYDRTSEEANLDRAHRVLFSNKARGMKAITPTVYQGGYNRKRCLTLTNITLITT